MQSNGNTCPPLNNLHFFMFLVSVIVPNYNHASFLRQRFDSIFNQTFQNFEVIILDDCSTDNSKEIIEEYRNHPQVSHIIYNETNSGSPFKQWAKGFNLAKGEYIWIAESDDWAELNFLEEMVSALQKDCDTVLAFSNSIWFSEYGVQKHSDVFRRNRILSGNSFFYKKMITHNSICNASCVLFKRRILLQISTLYQTFKGCGDWIFWIEFCRRGNICYISKALNHFRQHEKSTTKKSFLSGTTYKESFLIYSYIKKQTKIPFLKRHCWATFFLTYPKKNPNIVANYPEICKDINEKWKKEIWSPLFSRIYVDVMFVSWNVKKFIYSILNKEIDDFF